MKFANKVQKEVELQVYNRLQKLREVAESATTEGTVCNVEVDNKTFFMEFSQDSRVDIGKVFNGARNLGLNKGDLNLGGNIVRLGDAEKGSFTRSGRWGDNSQSTEIIKCAKPQSSETIWVDKIKSSKIASVERS